MEMIDVLKRLQEIAETKPELVADAVDNVQRTNPKEQVQEGGMSDIHIGAQEAVAEFSDEDGNLKMPKADVIAALIKKSKTSSFPASYEYETAADMVRSEYDDDGERKAELDMQSESKAKPDFLDMDKDGDKKEPMKKAIKDKEMKKETVKESIQISADTPEEAGMMMQILKLAGVKPVDAKMIGAEEPKDEPENHDDATGSMDMARMRDIIKKPEDEKAEETFANEPEEKVSDVDTLVNVHSGGANRQKTSYKKEYPGDNPMAVEDKITEEELANSLRSQYESFKADYQNAVTEAKKKD